MKIIFSMLCCFTMAALFGQSQIARKWKTVDDNTGKVRSVVEIYEQNGRYFGKILRLFPEPGEDPDPVCDECDPGDERYMQKVIGMEIIRDMEYVEDEDTFDEGTILDPENGSVYDCKLWVEDGLLKVRGYILFLFRTQTWQPYEG